MKRLGKFLQFVAIINTLPPFLGAFFQPIIKPPTVSYKFGEHLNFSGTVATPENIEESYLFIQISGETDTYSFSIIFDGSGYYSRAFPLKEHPIRAYSNITYWIEIKYKNEPFIASEKRIFIYEDTRFIWKSRTDERFTVYWYQGDERYGQLLLDIARLGLTKINNLLSLPNPEIIRIYAFDSAQELRESLQASGQTWIGAHTDPVLGVIMLSLPQGPEQRIEMERQIPHELMHLLLYQELGTNYQNLPLWLNEGLASIVELYPNPDYIAVLESARNHNQLLPIESLCHRFPEDASSAFLAYAEASSFTLYIENTFGQENLKQLIDTYKDSIDCEKGVLYTLKLNLTSLEHQWREEVLGEIIWKKALTNILPWILLLMIVLFMPIAQFLATLKKQKSTKISSPQ